MKLLLFFAIALLQSGLSHCPVCSAQMIVGHRGASFDAPENTLSAFRLAFEQGADAIEGDCHLTRDNQIIFTHDYDTHRVSGVSDVKWKIAETTNDQLRTLDVGSWKDPKFSADRMPSLAEVCEVVPPGKVFLIEIKCGPEIIPLLKEGLDRTDLKNNQLRIISFNREVIRAAKLVFPEIDCYWLCRFRKDKESGHWYPSTESIVATALEIKADGVDIQANMKLVNPSFVKACRKADLGLHAWTVDAPEIAMQLSELGFDSITTNRPAYLRKALSKPVGSGSSAQKANRVDSPSDVLEPANAN